MQIDLKQYEEVEWFSGKQKPKIGDIVYHRDSKKIEITIDKNTDLIQTEFYPLIENFGCVLLRKKYLQEKLNEQYKAQGLKCKAFWLSRKNRRKILVSGMADHLIVGGTIDQEKKMLSFWTGGGQRFVVPLDFFIRLENGVEPNFDEFEIEEWGHWIEFGSKYRVNSDIILKETKEAND